MAQGIHLPSVIESDARQVYEEYTVKHAYPNLGDGCCNVHRSILYAFMKDYKGESTRADTVCSYVQLRYHLHSSDSIHRTALMMSSERLPLIRASSRNKVYANREGIIASRYVNYYRTKWGEYVHKSLINASMIKNYSLTDEMPAYYPTMFPYLLFTNYTNINFGVSNSTLPFNPGDIFNMMRVLLRNLDAPIEDLLRYFTGPDIGANYTIVGHPQSRYALLTEGYGKFDVLTNMEFTRDTIIFKDVPYRSSKNKFLKKLASLQLETATLGKPDKRASRNFVMTVPYKLKQGYTIKDLQKELYTQTTLKKTIAVELIGFKPCHPDDINSGKLDIIGIRELLQTCLHYGYTQRVQEVKLAIEEVYKEVDHNSLLEKLTRPEVYKWFEPLISAKGINREEVLLTKGNAEITDFKIGEYITVKGGLTRAEVKETFARTGNSILGNLDTRPYILSRLAELDRQLAELHKELEPKAIMTHLDGILEDWSRDEACARQSQILFSNIDTAITTKCEASERALVTHMLNTSDNVDIPVNFVFYKDGTVNYWNPEKTVNIPVDMLDKPIHSIVKCKTQDTLLVFCSARRFKVKARHLVNDIAQYNNIYSNPGLVFQGVLVYEWNIEEPDVDDYLFMVTSRNRIKKMAIRSLLQKFVTVKPLPLYDNEYIRYMRVIRREELDDFTLELITSRGIKRRHLGNMLVKGLKGFITLVAYDFDRELTDFRLCKNEDTVRVFDNGEFKSIEINSEDTLKRDIYREVIVEEEGKYSHYINDKDYFNAEGEPVTPNAMLGLPEDVDLQGVLTNLPEGYTSAYTYYSKSRLKDGE